MIDPHKNFVEITKKGYNDIGVPSKVLIEKQCSVTQEIYKVTVDYGPYVNFMRGHHAQDVFPHLSAEQREFLISGITPGEWNAMFPEPEY